MKLHDTEDVLKKNMYVSMINRRAMTLHWNRPLATPQVTMMELPSSTVQPQKRDARPQDIAQSLRQHFLAKSIYDLAQLLFCLLH